MSGAIDQTLEVARRAFLRAARQPAAVMPALIFPMVLVAMNTGGLDAATELPGFPTDSYLTFALAVPFIQGAIFALLNSGTELASDVESGFLDRMALTPIGRAALLAGALGGVLAVALVQAVFYLAVGLAAGADFAAGLWGVPVLFALSLSISFAFGCAGTFAALRLGSSEAMQGTFPVFFVFLFFSTMALPLDLIEQSWFQTLARFNPVTYLIDGVRSLFVTGLDWGQLAVAFAIAGAIAAVFLVAAARALRLRMVRT